MKSAERISTPWVTGSNPVGIANRNPYKTGFSSCFGFVLLTQFVLQAFRSKTSYFKRLQISPIVQRNTPQHGGSVFVLGANSWTIRF
jgi:hypothetical protein